MCSTLWPKTNLTENFSPIGAVVPEIWPAKYVLKNVKKREKEEVLKMIKKSRKNSHYSKTTGPNQLKFCLAIGFGHRMSPTKFQCYCFCQCNCDFCDVQSDSMMCELLRSMLDISIYWENDSTFESPMYLLD